MERHYAENKKLADSIIDTKRHHCIFCKNMPYYTRICYPGRTVRLKISVTDLNNNQTNHPPKEAPNLC